MRYSGECPSCKSELWNYPFAERVECPKCGAEIVVYLVGGQEPIVILAPVIKKFSQMASSVGSTAVKYSSVSLPGGWEAQVQVSYHGKTE